MSQLGFMRLLNKGLNLSFDLKRKALRVIARGGEG